MSTSSTGVITWLEIPVVSVGRAAKFYTDVLGWEVDGVGTDGEEPRGGMPSTVPGVESLYRFCRAELHGCFMKVQQADIAVPPLPGKAGNFGVLVTYRVQSIEDTLAKVEAAGGAVHVPKTAIGNNFGFFARFVDTEGNLQGLWAQT